LILVKTGETARDRSVKFENRKTGQSNLKKLKKI
jgi:hypothetical protein